MESLGSIIDGIKSEVLKGAKVYEVQVGLFFGVTIAVGLAERLNALGAAHWEKFATQNYFDDHGIFAGALFCAPMLSLCMLLNLHLAARCQKLAASVAHVLRDGGRFLQITFSQPHFRRPLLLAGGAAAPWRCETSAVTLGFGRALRPRQAAPGRRGRRGAEARPADAARRRAPSASSDDEADAAAWQRASRPTTGLTSA
ncbi:DNA binding protein [Aureococcus anophagefferens]|nr:DNA binding protein [Aureococcus anophagefferens]